MLVLKTTDNLTRYLEKHDCKAGCFADTGFLYAISYQDDRLYNSSSEVLDILSEYEIPVHANVISRMEFIDLIFRKQITLGAIQLFNSLKPTVSAKGLYNLLKDIRDKNTASQRENRSYKVDERRLKTLRKELSQALEVMSWKELKRIPEKCWSTSGTCSKKNSASILSRSWRAAFLTKSPHHFNGRTWLISWASMAFVGLMR